MLRIHMMHQCYDLSDPAMEDTLIEVPTMRQFAGNGEIHLEVIGVAVRDRRNICGLLQGLAHPLTEPAEQSGYRFVAMGTEAIQR
jgi:hypothetical protein